MPQARDVAEPIIRQRRERITCGRSCDRWRCLLLKRHSRVQGAHTVCLAVPSSGHAPLPPSQLQTAAWAVAFQDYLILQVWSLGSPFNDHAPKQYRCQSMFYRAGLIEGCAISAERVYGLLASEDLLECAIGRLKLERLWNQDVNKARPLQ